MAQYRPFPLNQFLPTLLPVHTKAAGASRGSQRQGNSSQPQFFTQPLAQTGSRNFQRNTPPTVAGYSSLQSLAEYISGQGHSHGNMSNQSYAVQRSNQVQKKDQSCSIPVGELTAEGYF